jgi:hypothetical protein
MGNRSFAHSLLDIDPRRPFCLICLDIYYIHGRDGRERPCPACHCPRCMRLKAAHPDNNGCDCNEKAQQKEARHG